MHSSRRSPAAVARCRAAHRPISPSSPLAQPCRIEHDTELLGPAGKQHALGLLGWAEVPIASCARTCTRRHPDCAARATAGRARSCCCCCCCCCCRWHAAAAAAAAAPHIPPGGPQPPGATSEHTGARTPSRPRSVRHHAPATSESAISPLPGLGQTIRSSLSASGAGDAQGTAKAKDSRTTRAARLRNVRQRAPIRPRGGGRHKGACEGGERDWDGVFCSSPVSPGPWATPRRSAASSATKTRRLSATDSRRRPRFAPGSSGKEE